MEVSLRTAPVNVALGVFAAVTLLIQGGRAWRRQRQQ